jgi:hypothetical protein
LRKPYQGHVSSIDLVPKLHNIFVDHPSRSCLPTSPFAWIWWSLSLWIMLWLYHPNLWILHWFCPIIWLSAITRSQVSDVDLPKSLISDHSHTHSLRIMTMFYLNTVSMWINECCYYLWISHVSKSLSISISWLVPPHIKYRINLWLIIPVRIIN